MLASLAEVLDAHRERGTAAGAFTCYGMEGAAAVLRAAVANESPGVILLISPQAFASELGEALLATLLALGERSPVRVCVQLDHAPELAPIRRALEAGAGAVMADGSRLGFEQNVALAAAAVELARASGAQVEVELGHVAGDEEAAAATRAGSFTDPAEARELVERSGASCLAVSIGNVHGHYAAEPRLDFDLLDEVRASVDVPLALHGASGLPDQLVAAAIERGIAKINVNTELRGAYVAALAAELPAVRDGFRVQRLGAAAADAVAAVALEKLRLFETNHRGGPE